MNSSNANVRKTVAKKQTAGPTSRQRQGASHQSDTRGEFGSADVLGLQGAIGNQAVGLLLRQTAHPAFAGAQVSSSGGTGPSPASCANDAQACEFLITNNGDSDASFNLTQITNDLERGINQAEVAPFPGSNPQDSSTWTRRVNASKVIEVLADRTPTQIRAIREFYLLRCKQPLDVDLFEVNKSGHGSYLNANQKQRIRALLQGTKAETFSNEKVQGLENDRAANVQGDFDAAEIRELLSKGLGSEANRERVMTLTRRAGKEIDAMDSSYRRLTGRLLTSDVDSKLSGLQLARHAALRSGDRIKADACAIEAKRREIPTGKSFEDVVGRERLTKPNLAAIESIIGLTRQEAKAEALATGVDANALVQKRLTELLGNARGREDGTTIGESLTATFGKTAGEVLNVGAKMSLIDAHAQEMLRMETEKTTSSAKIASILKTIRSEAQADLMRCMADPWLGRSEKHRIQENFDNELTTLTMKYHKQFADSYDRIRGEYRTFSAIASNADLNSGNWAMLQDLLRGGGKLSDYDALEFAIAKKNIEEIKAIMARLSRQELNEIEKKYNSIHSTSIRVVLFGKYDEMASGSNVTQAEAEQKQMVRDGKFVSRGGLLTGRHATAVNEALQKPNVMEGVEEVNWLEAFGLREKNVTQINSGTMGTMRDWTGVPESKKILLRTNGDLGAMAVLWHEEKEKLIAKPANTVDEDSNKKIQLRQRAILLTMRKVRAALTGDAAAYEEENKAMVESLKSAISLAVQLALAVVMPGVSNLLGEIALSIATSVATNVLIQGDAYSLKDLRNDILGGAAGGLGGKLSKALGESAGALAGEVAERILPSVASATGKASRVIGISSKLGGEVAGVVGGNMSTSIANGQSIGSGFTIEGFLQTIATVGIGKVKASGKSLPKQDAIADPSGIPKSAGDTMIGHPGMHDGRGPGVDAVGPTQQMTIPSVDPVGPTQQMTVPAVDPLGPTQQMQVVGATESGLGTNLEESVSVPKRNAQVMDVPRVPGVTERDLRAKQFDIPEVDRGLLHAESQLAHAEYEAAKKSGNPSTIAAAKANFEDAYSSLLAVQGKGGNLPQSMLRPSAPDVYGPKSPQQITDLSNGLLKEHQQAAANGWDTAPALLKQWQAAYGNQLALTGIQGNAPQRTMRPSLELNKLTEPPPSSRVTAGGSVQVPAASSVQIPIPSIAPSSNPSVLDASKTLPGMGVVRPGTATLAPTDRIPVPEQVTQQIPVLEQVTQTIPIPEQVTQQIPIPAIPEASEAHLTTDQKEAAMTSRNQERNAYLLEGFDESKFRSEGPLHSIEDRALKDITTDQAGNVTHHLQDVRSVRTQEFDGDGKPMDTPMEAGPAPATMIAQPGFQAFGRDDFRPVRDNGVIAAHQAEVVSGPDGSHIRTPLEMSGSNPVVWGERGTALGPDGQWQSSQSNGVDDIRVPQTFDPNAPANFQPRTPAEMMAWEATNGPLPADQRYALWHYTDDGSSDMNRQLRSGDRSDPNALVNEIQNRDIDAAMRPLPMDVETSRKVGINAFESLGVKTPDQLKGLVGADYTDHGNISTSIAGKWSGQVHMVIEAPAGTRARYLSANADSSLGADQMAEQAGSQAMSPLGTKSGPIASMPGEFELMLERGTTFRIVGVVEPAAAGGPWTVRMRVVSQGVDPAPGG